MRTRIGASCVMLRGPARGAAAACSATSGTTLDGGDGIDELDGSAGVFFLDECARLAPFTNVGEAVFHVEYEVGVDEF